MKTIPTEKHGIVHVSLEGRLGKALNPGFEKTIREILKSDTRRLLFDLSALEYLTSADLRVILKAAKAIHRKSGKVVLCCLKGYVKEVFEVTCLEDMIAISDSVESGCKELLRESKAA